MVTRTKVALVTGAARNIGRATAIELARQGFEVVVHTRRDADTAQSVVDAITSAGGSARVALAELAERAEVIALAERAGHVDVLVNNAAIRPHTPFLEIGWDEWRDVIGVDLDAPFLLSQALLPGMRAAGWGRIVNVTGVRATQGASGKASTSAAKHAVVGLTRSLANEFGPDGITVNAICPGTIRTDRDGDDSHRLGDRHGAGALDRFGEPREIAAMIAYLVSDAGGYVTGQTIGVNGGELML